MRNDNNCPNLAIEYPFGAKKSVRSYRKIQKWKIGPFPYAKTRGGEENVHLIKWLERKQLEM